MIQRQLFRTHYYIYITESSRKNVKYDITNLTTSTDGRDFGHRATATLNVGANIGPAHPGNAGTFSS
jgi:hypothetical protein